MKTLIFSLGIMILISAKTLFAGVEKGVDVKTVQRMLTELCFNVGTIDGVWGKKTESGAHLFFKNLDKYYDGIFDGDDFLILKDEYAQKGSLNCSATAAETSMHPPKLGYSHTYEERQYDIYNPDRGMYRDVGNSNLNKPFGHGDLNPRYHNFQRLNENIPQKEVIKDPYCKEYCFGTMNVSQPLRFEWMRINDYFDKPIDQGYLDRLQDFLNDARNQGYKLILRWSYTFPNEADDPNHKAFLTDRWDQLRTPKLGLIIQHIEQLAPIINRNKDIIFAVQAGMLGAWGEWHSDQYGDERRWKPARYEVLKTWLDYTDNDVVIQIRYPQDYFRKEIQSLSEYDRVGLHHDCPNYRKDKIEFFKYRRKLKSVPLITGEMCDVKALTSYSCSEMVKYFDDFNFTALRVGYPDEIFVRWHEQGCLSEIRDRLGYRFVLLNSHFDGKVLTIKLKNKGFARTHKSRKVSIKIGKKIYSTGLDAITWEPDKLSTIVIDLDKIGATPTNAKSLEVMIEGGVRFLNITDNKIFLQ